jgi:hypothetical protein
VNVTFDEVAIGTKWTRHELATLWGYRSFQALGRGVVTPADDNKIVFFLTHTKPPDWTQYVNSMTGSVLRMEGERTHGTDARIVNAERDGDEVHLFYREETRDPFTYYGKLLLTSYELKEDSPSKFEFKLLNSVTALTIPTSQAGSIRYFCEKLALTVHIEILNAFTSSEKRATRIIFQRRAREIFVQVFEVPLEDIAIRVEVTDGSLKIKFIPKWSTVLLIIDLYIRAHDLHEDGAKDVQWLIEKWSRVRSAIVQVSEPLTGGKAVPPDQEPWMDQRIWAELDRRKCGLLVIEEPKKLKPRINPPP